MNFQIERDTERVVEVLHELKIKENKKLTSKELETYANYILYGKDEKGNNIIDRKEGFMSTKYNSYKRREMGSLEELMELPGFDQQHFKPMRREIYTNPKPTLDYSIPAIKNLSEEIERIEGLYELHKQKNDLSDTQLYHYNHFLISLRKQQYTLMDSIQPKFQKKTDQKIYYDLNSLIDNADFYPLGLKIGDLKRFSDPRNSIEKQLYLHNSDLIIDFCNPEHVYVLLEFYNILYLTSLDNPFTSTKYLVETIDYYIEKAKLPPERDFILKAKRAGYSNSQIHIMLEKNFKVGYSDNYISTIYVNDICKRIAVARQLHEEEFNCRGKKEKWKQCNMCGEWKLRTNQFFGKKNNTEDGLSFRCKACDKIKRNKNKK